MMVLNAGRRSYVCRSIWRKSCRNENCRISLWIVDVVLGLKIIGIAPRSRFEVELSFGETRGQ